MNTTQEIIQKEICYFCEKELKNLYEIIDVKMESYIVCQECKQKIESEAR